MAFRSKAQRRKFAQLLVEGKITDEAYERWNKETGGTELPEYVDPKRKPKRQSTRARKPKASSVRKRTTKAKPTSRTGTAARRRKTSTAPRRRTA